MTWKSNTPVYAGQEFLTVKFSLEDFKLIVKRENIFKTYFQL